MKTTEVPTAEEYCKQLDEELGEYWSNDYEDLPKYMAEFAKLHVQKALETAVKKIKSDALEQYGSDVPDCWNENSILEAYPIENIK